MLVECMAIFGLILVVVITYLRNGKKQYAIATIPLLVLPFVNIIAYFTSKGLASIFPFEKFTAYTVLNLLAVIISSLLVGIWSNKFKRSYTRAVYVTMCIIFNILLASILVHSMYVSIYE